MKRMTSLKADEQRIKPSAVWLLLLLLSIHGCSSKIGSSAAARYNNNPLAVAIPAGLSPDAVEKVMVKTLVMRRWSIKNHARNEVVGRLNHREYDATVTLQSDGSVITILNEATHRDLNTGEVKPGVPMGWLANIQNDLRSRLTAALYQ